MATISSKYPRSLNEDEIQQCSLFLNDVQEQSDIDLLTDKAGSLHIAAISLLSASTNHYVPKAELPRSIQAAANPFSQHGPTTYREAVLTGGLEGVKDLWKAVQHPVDNLIQPLYDLSLDTVVIASKMSDTPLLSTMRDRVEQNPELYSTALSRMHTRVDHLTTFAREFAEADDVKKVEIATEFAVVAATGVLARKGIVKVSEAAGEALITSGQSVKNKLLEPIPFDPHEFHTQKPFDTTFRRTMVKALIKNGDMKH